MSVDPRRVTIKGTFHALIAVAGWVLFVYWWKRVLPPIDSRDASLALFFIGITVLATAVVTMLWVQYNIGIYRRKGPRKRLPRISEDHATDALGRMIVGPGQPSLRAARLVVVSLEGEAKKYDVSRK